MRRAGRACIALAFGACIVVGGASCRGDGSRSVATPSSSPASSPTPAATRTPVPPPEITGNHVSYPAKHYALDMPEGWSFQANEGIVADLQLYPTDALFSTATGPEDPSTAVRTNVEVSCLARDPAVQGAAALKAQWFDYVDKLLNHGPLDEPIGELTVAGSPAFRFHYRLDLGARKLDQVDVVFLTSDCRWLLRLVRLRDGDTSSDQQFMDVLMSFKLLP